jgi:FkbM family methyltransferase
MLAHLGRRFGNELYKFAFPIYRPLYRAFKSHGDRIERRVLASRLRPGSVVVDAGANIGIYSQFLSKCVGPDGKVHSFEPSPDNFRRLRSATSGFSNVHANQLAVSDKTGESVLYISDKLNVDHRAYPTEGETRRTLSIKSIRLDDYFKPGERVDFIKMDIQGFELQALRGAERVLTENPKAELLVEFWPYGLERAGTSGEELVRFLRDRGFHFFTVKNNRLSPCPEPWANPDDPAHYFDLFAQPSTPVSANAFGR